MKLQVVLAGLGLAAALLVSSCADLSKMVATKTPAARVANAGQGESWDTIKRLPDWSGVWNPQSASEVKPTDPPKAPQVDAQLTPAYADELAAYKRKIAPLEKANKRKSSLFVTQASNCVPYGMPQSMREPYPVEFLFTPGRVTIAMETDSIVRRIYTDGRKVPDDPDPTYQGYSVGHWEGDTLVIETDAVLPGTVVVTGIEGHGKNLHVSERIHLIGPDLLEQSATMTDPDMLIAPYTLTQRYVRHRDWAIMEYVCTQNNRDGMDAKGNPTFNLDRKPGE